MPICNGHSLLGHSAFGLKKGNSCWLQKRGKGLVEFPILILIQSDLQKTDILGFHGGLTGDLAT